MEKGLTGAQISRIDVSGRILFVDPRDLIGEESIAAQIVIYPRRPHVDDRNRAVLLMNQTLGLGLRLAVRKVGFEGPVFVDDIARATGLVRQHRTREDELFDLECPQRMQELVGAANGDLLVERVRFAREVEVRRQMDDGGNALSISYPYATQGCIYRFRRCQIDTYALCIG